jgi:hypothetical protein
MFWTKDEETPELKTTEKESLDLHEKDKGLKRPIRIVLAIVLIIFLYTLWIGLGAVLFGWTHGGGAIPTMLFFSLAIFLWRTITKKTPKEKEEAQNNADSNGPKIEGHER